MSQENIEFVLKTATDKNVKFIRLWFVDILGALKSFAITCEELEHALLNGMTFDGAAIEGVVRHEENELIAKPDPATFQLLPWRPKENAVARMFCDIYTSDEKPYVGDPRFILKKALKKATDMGYSFYVGPQPEFFYFKDDKAPECLDKAGYFDLTHQDISSDLRRETVLTLEKMGIPVEYSFHESASSQHEIDLRYADALTMADNLITYKLVVKEVASKHGVYASFMPKPLNSSYGSGLHINQSLFKGEKNIFFDPDDEYHLSPEAKCFTAGLLKHAASFTSITCQWVNSYKRLVHGFEAPTCISWAHKNRSTLIRVPRYRKNRDQSTRIELRSPDPACNPYLTFAVILAAGLDGIENKYKLPLPVEEDISKMGAENRQKVASLPESLHEALILTQRSKLIKDTLGEVCFEMFLENKRVEWNDFKKIVTGYELDKYLSVL